MKIDIAKTDEEIYQGLSYRWLNEDEGMLFILKEKMPFTMRDMMVPLDLMWLDKDGIVVYLRSYCPPGNSTLYEPDEEVDYKYVLEMAHGFISKYDIKVGGRLDVKKITGRASLRKLPKFS